MAVFYRKEVYYYMIKIFKNSIIIYILLLSCHTAMAENDPILQMNMGSVKIYQKNSYFTKVQLKNKKYIQTDNIYWPPINMDDEGLIYFGDKIINSDTGNIIVNKKNKNLSILGKHYEILINKNNKSLSIINDGKKCVIPIYLFDKGFAKRKAIDLLKDTSLRFVDADGPLVVLVTIFGDAPRDIQYRVITLQPQSCKIISTVNLGNPDFLIELGWSSKGGWWITGITETTLLRSKDGKNWKPINLPDTISELLSAYIQDDNHIWLAANDSRMVFDDNSLSIINSKDGGNTWSPIAHDNAIIKEMPRNWLEGQMRAHGREK